MYQYSLLFFAFLLNKSLCLHDYYWRDYTGIIPEDAVPGGHDINNAITYIGLVYLSDAGVYPATIQRGDRVLYACADKIRKSENFIQILCAENKQNFQWIPVNKTHFHFTTMNKHLVRGGIQDKNWLQIGRINFQGELLIGKVLSGRAGIHDVMLKFIHNDVEKVAYSYEVLTFDENISDPKTDAEVLSLDI